MSSKKSKFNVGKLNKQIGSLQHPFEIGAKYLIRTVTNYLTGRVVAITQSEIVLEEAAWIADTGRFATALKSGEYAEVEPYPDGHVIVGRGALVDACRVSELPRSQK